MAESEFDDCRGVAHSNGAAGGTAMIAGRGLGIITTSSLDVPQVNAPASVAAFITPAAIPVNMNPATNGEKTGMESCSWCLVDATAGRRSFLSRLHCP